MPPEKLAIIIESKSEESVECNFLKTFIKKIIKKDIDKFVNFYPINGWTSLKNIRIPLEKGDFIQKKNIIIFDADDPSKDNGGFQNRKNKIENKIENMIKGFKDKIDYPLFLFPNNKDDGDFETLLENIINPKHQQLLDCFGKYEGCIEKSDQYNTPNRKAKMYAYITSFQHNKTNLEKVKKRNWFFDDEEYWDLAASYLFPLKDFLEKNVNY